MRLKAAIRIDLRRGKGQNLLRNHRISRPFEDAEEEAEVGDGVIDFAIGRHDDEDGAFG